MSAGTITLTNKSAVVSGNGTSFTTEVAAGDFIVVTVGGIPYTLPVKSVESGAALTLVSNFTGPTQSGAAWSAVPRMALNMVTAALVAQSAEALRGLNYDKQNWQQVFSASGMITVKLPDGSSFPGPSWKYLSDKLSSLGNSATRDVGTDSGTVAAGNDTRFETVNGKTGGDISSQISVSGNIYAVNKSVSEPANGTDVSGGSI
ncbi:tail fiber domain-containing protein, partial [Citrobacter freundii]